MSQAVMVPLHLKLVAIGAKVTERMVGCQGAMSFPVTVFNAACEVDVLKLHH